MNSSSSWISAHNTDTCLHRKTAISENIKFICENSSSPQILKEVYLVFLLLLFLSDVHIVLDRSSQNRLVQWVHVSLAKLQILSVINTICTKLFCIPLTVRRIIFICINKHRCSQCYLWIYITETKLALYTYMKNTYAINV